MKKLILASASPRRKELMEMLKYPFEVIPADIPEEVKIPSDALVLAENKAAAILKKHPEAVVIGADTIVCIDNEILGKPAGLAGAKEMLLKLSGRQHSVYTGYAIVSRERNISELVETRVFVEVLSSAEIDFYLQNEHVLDAAGAYKIQGLFSRHIMKIEGDYFNVVGFPVNRIYHNLQKFILS